MERIIVAIFVIPTIMGWLYLMFRFLWDIFEDLD